MLADAIRAEAYRFSLNRLQVFVTVVLTPLLFAVGGALFHIISKSRGDAAAQAAGLTLPASTTPVNLGEAFAFAAGGSANGVILICILIGAATLYAGDYRWESWRLISARNDRVSLILAKLGVLKILAIASSVAFLAASFVFLIAQAVVYQRGMSFSIDGAEAGRAALVWLLSYVRIIQFTMIALLTAVLSRSLLAALFVPWALGFVQGITGTAMPLLGWEPQMWLPQLLLPGLAYDTLKAAVEPGPLPAPFTDATVWRSLTGFALWTVLPLIGALVWFRRQDLSKE
jgi:ABC-2 type transport system permease protein